MKTIWDNDFTDCDGLPVDVSETLNDPSLSQNLAAVKKALLPWCDDEEAQGLFTVLLENDLSHKSLVTMLFFIMDMGEKVVFQVIHRNYVKSQHY